MDNLVDVNFDQFVRAVLSLLPEASVEEDLDGQLVIYTNLKLNDGGYTVEFDSEEEGYG